MKACSPEQLKKVQLDYDAFRRDNVSNFKAAFLATSSNGFIHTVYIDAEQKEMTLKSDDDHFIKMVAFEEKTPVIITKQSFSFTVE